MRPTALVVLYRTLLIVAICASAALVIEYMKAGDPAFCGVGSACFKVRVSDFAREFSKMAGGLTLPQLGLGAHLALLAGSLVARSARAHWVLAGVNVVGALFAAVLLYVQQTKIGAFCPWCVVVDSASMAAAIVAVLVARKRSAEASDEPAEWLKKLSAPSLGMAWGAAASVATAAPFMWASAPVIPDMPPVIAERQVEGKVTIIAFTDFECPFCRRLNPEFKELKEEHGDKLAYQRIMVPLDIHPGAKPAALAYLCTPEDRRDEMADLLYGAEKLNALGVVKLAEQLGLAKEKFVPCLAATNTLEQLKAEKALFDTITSRGLPTTYIGARAVMGFNPDGVRTAVNKELAGSGLALPLWLMILLVGGAAAGAIAITAKKVNSEDDEEKKPAKKKKSGKSKSPSLKNDQSKKAAIERRKQERALRQAATTKSDRAKLPDEEEED